MGAGSWLKSDPAAPGDFREVSSVGKMSTCPKYQMYIDGLWCALSDKRTFESIDPNAGEPWAHLADARAQDVDRAVTAARRAHETTVWVNTYRTISPAAPFRVYKKSGNGRERGVEARRDYTQVRML